MLQTQYYYSHTSKLPGFLHLWMVSEGCYFLAKFFAFPPKIMFNIYMKIRHKKIPIMHHKRNIIQKQNLGRITGMLIGQGRMSHENQIGTHAHTCNRGRERERETLIKKGSLSKRQELGSLVLVTNPQFGSRPSHPTTILYTENIQHNIPHLNVGVHLHVCLVDT